MGKDDSDFNKVDIIIFIIVALTCAWGLVGVFLVVNCSISEDCKSSWQGLKNFILLLLFAVLLYELRTKQNINKPDFVEKIDNTTVILLYILSFAIPLAGFIVGAIYATKEDEHYKFVGKNCLIFSLMNIIIMLIMVALLFA